MTWNNNKNETCIFIWRKTKSKRKIRRKNNNQSCVLEIDKKCGKEHSNQLKNVNDAEARDG